jgi:hypothetical protein
VANLLPAGSLPTISGACVLADQRAAIRIGHPVVRLDPLLASMRAWKRSAGSLVSVDTSGVFSA